MPPTHYLPHLEWEFLHQEHRIKNPSIPKSLPGTPRLLEVRRNDQYLLEATITGPLGKSDITKEQTPPGGFVQPFEIKGVERDETYELTGCIIRNSHSKVTTSEISTMVGRFQADLYVQKIRRIRAQPQSSLSWLTEWYLNGVHKHHLFPRSTTRLRTTEYIREREVYKEQEHHFEAENFRSDSTDYAYIRCPDFGFIVHGVPEGLGPAWSKSIGIEYREEFGRIPVPSEREAISEIVGFIMGKHLLNVGYSVFDESGTRLELCAMQPWGDNVVSLCQAPAFPPIKFPLYTNLFETALQDLVPKYLEAREDLNFDEALMRYWIGNALPTGTDIPIIASGVEILANAWFKSERSKSKGTYLPEEEFSALMEEELASIANRLGDNSYKDRLLGKIRGANNRGSGERVELFFQELGLNICTLEKRAIKARNKMIHSRVTATGQGQCEDLIRLSFAYRTLFHRVVMKILGYSGKYLDYATEGLPERAVEEAVGWESSA